MVEVDIVPLTLFLIGMAAIGLFNIVLSITLFQLYSSMYRRYHLLLKKEMKTCETEINSSTQDGSLQEWEHPV